MLVYTFIIIYTQQSTYRFVSRIHFGSASVVSCSQIPLCLLGPASFRTKLQPWPIDGKILLYSCWFLADHTCSLRKRDISRPIVNHNKVQERTPFKRDHNHERTTIKREQIKSTPYPREHPEDTRWDALLNLVSLYTLHSWFGLSWLWCALDFGLSWMGPLLGALELYYGKPLSIRVCFRFAGGHHLAV